MRTNQSYISSNRASLASRVDFQQDNYFDYKFLYARAINGMRVEDGRRVRSRDEEGREWRRRRCIRRSVVHALRTLNCEAACFQRWTGVEFRSSRLHGRRMSFPDALPTVAHKTHPSATQYALCRTTLCYIRTTAGRRCRAVSSHYPI